MQVKKDDIRNRILNVAKDAFLKEGYLKTSMRSIAEQSGVGVGNIYNYFKGKDALFRCLVNPVIIRFNEMLQEHHGNNGADIMQLLDEKYLRLVIDEYISLMRNHRDLMTLLFFKAYGSSLENFKETYTDRSTDVVKSWFSTMKTKYPEVNVEFTDIFIHMQTVWMFTMFEEILKHKVTDKNMEKVLTEYIRFEINGWRSMFHLESYKNVI